MLISFGAKNTEGYSLSKSSKKMERKNAVLREINISQLQAHKPKYKITTDSISTSARCLVNIYREVTMVENLDVICTCRN